MNYNIDCFPKAEAFTEYIQGKHTQEDRQDNTQNSGSPEKSVILHANIFLLLRYSPISLPVHLIVVPSGMEQVSRAVLLDFQVVSCLKVEPESFGSAEVAG